MQQGSPNRKVQKKKIHGVDSEYTPWYYNHVEVTPTTKAFRYRAYPTKEQEAVMLELLETHRRLYNGALVERRDAYQNQKRFVSYKEQSAQLTIRRRSDTYLLAASATSCHRTLRRLDRSFTDFFRRVKSGQKAGFPRFRGVGRFDSVEYVDGDGAKLRSIGKVYFFNVGEVKVKQHRPIDGTIKTIRFKREANHWYVIITCDIEVLIPDASTNPTVGIDLGLKSFFVTSEGESIDCPKFYRKTEKRLADAQRRLSRKKKGSANRKKAALKVARLHRRVANQRKDFHHKTALDLVRRFGAIAHEKLNVKGIARTRLAKSTHDAGWSSFLSILSHKAECAGVQVVAVNAKNTTQTCSSCGRLPEKSIGLSVRTYSCQKCGYIADRDHNAAVNIKNRAFG